MPKIDPNAPAIPTNLNDKPGLTIRQEFAKAAMQGMLAYGMTGDIGLTAVMHADALIAALNEDKP